MRIAALIIGIFGSIALFVVSILTIAVGGLGSAVGDSEGEKIAGLGVLALLLSIVAVVAAALAIAKPRLAAALMSITGIVSLFPTYGWAFPATILLLVAALLAFLGRRSGTSSS